MIEAQLVRQPISTSVPQLGVFSVEGKPQFLTLELPDRDNEPLVSCIPEGVYVCERVLGRITGSGMQIQETYEVMGVTGRSGILFHTGNTIKDTKGCILVGQTILGPDYIGGSKISFGYFLDAFKGLKQFRLTISRAHKLS